MITRISEALTGTVDGSNVNFTASQSPDLNSLTAFVNMDPVPVLSFVGTAITLSAPPPVDAQVFASYSVTSADNIDLTTLAAVKNRAEVKSDSEDAEIQALITGFSQYVLTRTCRDTLNQIKDFTEIYDGNGAHRLRLRNTPIISVASVKINGQAQDISSGYGVQGITIVDDDKIIAFSYDSCGRFTRGIGNIQVIYRAGYNGVPLDLEKLSREVIARAVKRKAWLGMKSKSISVQGGTGSTQYVDYELSKEEVELLGWYTRKVILA